MSLVAQTRQSVYGVTARMEDQTDTTKTFACYFSPVKSQEQLDAALFKDVHDTVLRVQKSETNFDPTLGKIVILIAAFADGSDMRVRIAEIGFASINPEHVCGCKAVF
jgi:hypothetical protein